MGFLDKLKNAKTKAEEKIWETTTAAKGRFLDEYQDIKDRRAYNKKMEQYEKVIAEEKAKERDEKLEPIREKEYQRAYAKEYNKAARRDAEAKVRSEFEQRNKPKGKVLGNILNALRSSGVGDRMRGTKPGMASRMGGVGLGLRSQGPSMQTGIRSGFSFGASPQRQGSRIQQGQGPRFQFGGGKTTIGLGGKGPQIKLRR